MVFANTTDAVLVASSNADGTAPSRFALKAKGTVISGELLSQTFEIEDYEKFLKLDLVDENVTEIVSVFDSNGNNYYEVDYLSQDVIYVPVLNTNTSNEFSKNIYKPVSVPRRFTTEFGLTGVSIQFGYGTEDNEEKVLDPTSVSLDVFGKDYITEKSFDPTVLTKTTKLGIVPSNTILTVIYRRNIQDSVNAPVDTLTQIVNANMSFSTTSGELLLSNETRLVRESLELTNESLITGDVSDISSEELKIRSREAYATQNRAVTKDDYVSLCYNMPSNFGQIKKAMITRDQTL